MPLIFTNLQLNTENTQYIDITFNNGEPRKEIAISLKNYVDKICLVGTIYVGRRIITSDTLYLLNGRRHRIYYALKKNNKLYIKFGWHKIKYLHEIELQTLIQNWHFDFFNLEGKRFIEKSGGVLSPHHLLYTKTHILI